MKITYNDMFDNISDVAFDVLEEPCTFLRVDCHRHIFIFLGK